MEKNNNNEESNSKHNIIRGEKGSVERQRERERWIQTRWQRHLWSTTTPPSTTTVLDLPLSTKKDPCLPSKVRRFKVPPTSSPSSLLSLSSSAITPSPPSIANHPPSTLACLSSSAVTFNSPVNNTPSNSVRSLFRFFIFGLSMLLQITIFYHQVRLGQVIILLLLFATH